MQQLEVNRPCVPFIVAPTVQLYICSNRQVVMVIFRKCHVIILVQIHVFLCGYMIKIIHDFMWLIMCDFNAFTSKKNSSCMNAWSSFVLLKRAVMSCTQNMYLKLIVWFCYRKMLMLSVRRQKAPLSCPQGKCPTRRAFQASTAQYYIT